MIDWIGPLFKHEEPDQQQDLPPDESNGDSTSESPANKVNGDSKIETPVKKVNGDSTTDDAKKTLYIDEEVVIENE